MLVVFHGTGIDPIDLIAEWLPCMIFYVYMESTSRLQDEDQNQVSQWAATAARYISVEPWL